jgi:hypothetical protein
LIHIDRLYCAQSHFHERLEDVVDLPAYADLEVSIRETMMEMKTQIENTHDLYLLYNLNECDINFNSCHSLLHSLEEDFYRVQNCSADETSRNFNLLSYILNIEYSILVAFQFLQLYKVKMDNKKNLMVERNYQEMKSGQLLKSALLYKVQFA